MGTQEYIVFALAGLALIYLAVKFYKKNFRKKSSNSGCDTDCNC